MGEIGTVEIQGFTYQVIVDDANGDGTAGNSGDNVLMKAGDEEAAKFAVDDILTRHATQNPSVPRHTVLDASTFTEIKSWLVGELAPVDETNAPTQADKTEPSKSTVTLYARDQYGALLKDAAVRVYDDKGNYQDLKKVEEGHFEATLKAGAYTLVVAQDDSIDVLRKIEVKKGESKEIDLPLHPYPNENVLGVELKNSEIVIPKGKIDFKKNDKKEEELTDTSINTLDRIISLLNDNPQIKQIRVGGHTDNRGDPDKNLELSKKRAQMVADYLKNHGLDPDRVIFEGYGQTMPLVPNLTPAQRAKNRRIEFKIIREDMEMVPFGDEKSIDRWAKLNYRRATDLFNEAKQKTDKALYVKAADLLLRCFEVKSNLTALLYNAALAYRMGDKPGEAIRYYRDYLKLAPGDAKDRQEAERSIAELEKQITGQAPSVPSPPAPK